MNRNKPAQHCTYMYEQLMNKRSAVFYDLFIYSDEKENKISDNFRKFTINLFKNLNATWFKLDTINKSVIGSVVNEQLRRLLLKFHIYS